MCALDVRVLDPDRELGAYLAVSNQARMGKVSREQWLESGARARGHVPRRCLVGESDGRIVVIASVADEDMAEDGVSTWVVTHAGHQPSEVRTAVRDDDPESRAWAERRGFTLFDHAFRSRLDLDAVDPAPHRRAFERAEAARLRFARFGPDDDPDRLFELFVRLLLDVPDQVQAPDRAYLQREVAETDGGLAGSGRLR